MPSRFIQPLLFRLAQSTHKELARQNQFLKAENEILRSKLPKQIRTTPTERKRLMKLGKPLGTALRDLITIVSYTSFLRWLRDEDGKPSKPSKTGRPAIKTDIRQLVIQLATDNNWGYTRIAGELGKLGHKICRSTVKNILLEAGLDPSPKRTDSTWDTFIKRHMDTLWACDFLSCKVLTKSGFVEYFVLFFIHVSSRRIHVAGITPHPHGVWMAQQARNLCMFFEEQPHKPNVLLRDGDKKFTAQFDEILKDESHQVIRLPYRSPNLNAFAERWVQSVKYECLNHFMIFGESHLRHLIDEYVAHYHHERPHQGLGNKPISANTINAGADGSIHCRERLGGLLKHYYRNVA